MKCQNYELRYPEITKHSFPEAPQGGEMRNKLASVAQSDVPPTGTVVRRSQLLIPARSCNILFFID